MLFLELEGGVSFLYSLRSQGKWLAAYVMVSIGFYAVFLISCVIRILRARRGSVIYFLRNYVT